MSKCQSVKVKIHSTFFRILQTLPRAVWHFDTLTLWHLDTFIQSIEGFKLKSIQLYLGTIVKVVKVVKLILIFGKGLIFFLSIHTWISLITIHILNYEESNKRFPAVSYQQPSCGQYHPTLADILGHESIKTTQIYLRRSCSEQKRIIDKIVTW